MTADRYYGLIAREYDQTRQHTATWKAENAIIKQLVTDGPVLDVPFGTGRYVPIYESKGLDYLGIDISSDMLAEAKRKHPNAECRVGSIFDLPTGFGTVVCSRMLNWLDTEEVIIAMQQLSQSADTLIFTINAGIDGDRRGTSTCTHSIDKLKGLVDGRDWEQHYIPGRPDRFGRKHYAVKATRKT